MLWINEGFILDDAGNLIMTSYIDLREDGSRTSIPALVKGCKREHALEDGETVLVSKPERFREFGEALIRDEQEGFVKEESVTVVEETAAEAAKRRAIADLNEAHELLNARVRSVRRETQTTRTSETRSVAFGKEWWVFCASIRPEDGEWEPWKATLDDEYDHVSEIGQPAKFAQALGHMVAEQIGPQGKDGSMTGTTIDGEGVRTNHKSQWVLHGPVVYTDRLYDMLTHDGDEMQRFAATIFAKSAEYAGQREYRFAIMNEGAEEETVLLKISDMMRDALRRTDGGLIRPVPAAADTVSDDETRSSPSTKVSTTPRSKRVTVKEREAEWEEKRGETRTADGKVLSSDSERRESVRETTRTQDLEPADEDAQTTLRTERHNAAGQVEQQAPGHGQDSAEDDSHIAEDVAQDIALAESEWKEGRGTDFDRIPVIHRGTGRTYKSFEEMFKDPAAPMSPATKTWQESVCSPEEIAKTFGAIEMLEMKIAEVKMEHRQEAASACWHAIQCLRNICARLGDIVESVWIERERFAVIRIKDSEELGATGRIVITPGGAYAYCLQLPNKEVLGHGGEEWGSMFFPMGSQEESFEEFGWSPRQRDSEPLESEDGNGETTGR